MAIPQQKESRSRLLPYSYRMTSRVYSGQYHYNTLHSGPLNNLEHCIMHHLDGRYPTPPIFKHSTFEFRATTGSNEPSGLKSVGKKHNKLCYVMKRRTIHRITVKRHWYVRWKEAHRNIANRVAQRMTQRRGTVLKHSATWQNHAVERNLAHHKMIIIIIMIMPIMLY